MGDIMTKKIKQKMKKKEIYYYRPFLQKFNKENGFKSVDNVSKELIEIFKRVKEMSLKRNDENNVYLQRDANTHNYIAIDFDNSNYIYGRLISSSNDVYPSIDQEGKLIPLKTKLPPNSNLAHTTHFVFFLDDNVVGIEYNNMGARPTSLASYITNKFDGEYHMELIESINSNALAKLEKTHRVKELDMQLDTRSIIEEQVKEGELYEALDAAQQIAKDSFSDDNLTISIKIKSKYGFKITNKVKESLKKIGLSRKVEENKKKNGERIKIKSLSEEDDRFEFDLVRQVIKAPKVSIKVDENNMIDSEDMFDKIISNYRKYK